MEYLLPCVQNFRSLKSALSTSPKSTEQVDRGMEVHQLYNFTQNTGKEHKNFTGQCHHGGLVAKSCPTFATPWTVAYQAPLSMGFPNRNNGVGCHFLLQGIFPTQGSNPGLLHCRHILYQLSYQGSPSYHHISI